MIRWSRVVLLGFSGTGKSTVSRLLACELGWEAVDTDAGIEARLDVRIPEIFERHGEAAFREVERSVLADALRLDQVVIGTGGGAVIAPDAWSPELLGDPRTLTVTLDVLPETSLARLRDQEVAEGGDVVRPLLSGPDPLGRIRQMKDERQAAYDRADITLPVDSMGADAVAREIALLVQGGPATVTLELPHASSSIVIEPGSMAKMGGMVRSAYPRARKVWLLTDDGVAPYHLQPATESLTDVNLPHEVHIVGHGEMSKSLTRIATVYDWLLNGGVERSDVIVALGGGVVGDMAGFVAATTLRGIGLVQVPTSLLAMVDSSVGGKTGINHAAGKNLIGAFYQPPLVVIDPAVLGSLPSREFTSGWSEIIKHALIQPSTPGGAFGDLWTFLERNVDALLNRREPAMSALIERNVVIKARVVEADEREAGLRAYLNFGHTIGHAIEAAGYKLLHGEAVAVGMRAAVRLGAQMGTCDSGVVAQLDALLNRFELPTTASAEPERVLALLGSDKKKQGGKQRWVLPRSEGGVELRDDVPREVVESVLNDMLVGVPFPSA